MSADELSRILVALVARVSGLDETEIDPRIPLDEYGLSSREAAELSSTAAELAGRPLPTTLLWSHPTIERLAAALAEPVGTVAAQPVSLPASGFAEPVAVIGVGCRLPGGVDGPEAFWRLLTEGRDAVSTVPPGRWQDAGTTTRWGGFLDDIAGFDAEFFGIAPREAARMDPQQRMVLEVAWEALEHAGIAPESLRGSDTGVFIGVGGTEYGTLSLSDLSTTDPWAATGAAPAVAANRLSYVLDLRGPSMAVDTACSSSLTAVHLAVQSLRSGESSLAIVGGANLLLSPGVTATFDRMGISSPSGRCRPFSADADGIVRAEGAGIVVLKALSRVLADGDRALAVIRGSATNSDGRSQGLTAPNPGAQKALLQSAYRQAGVDPSAVSYVEAHGTGTLLGDPIEATALGAVLGAGRAGDRPLLIGSMKGNLGHLEAAAGVVGLVKTVLSLHHRELPASVHFAGPNPHIDFEGLGLSVVDSRRHWPDGPVFAGVSGFGFGGTNTHVVLEQAPETPGSRGDSRLRRFPIGAADCSRLREHARRIADRLARERSPVSLADVQHTLARRLGGKTRAAVVASDLPELVEALRALPEPCAIRQEPDQGPVFVFSGHSAQWAGTGRRLLADEPPFAAAIDRLEPLIHAETGFSLRDAVRNGIGASTEDCAQPLVFGVQVALAELWASYGVRPAAVIGHSFGEVAAAVVAGALGEVDGARIVALRSRLLASLAAEGAMAMLELGADEAAELVAGRSDVDVAVLSSPNRTVIAGRADAVRQMLSDMETRDLLARLVKLDVAAHSPAVDEVTGPLADGLHGLRPTRPALTFYSTVLENPRNRPTFDGAYWATNLRRPVRFADAVSAATADGHRVFVEVSSHPALQHALRDNLSGSETLVVSTLHGRTDEVRHFHTQLGILEATGAVTGPATTGAIVDLPSTPWRHVRHWLGESTSETSPQAGTDLPRTTAPLIGLPPHRHASVPLTAHSASTRCAR